MPSQSSRETPQQLPESLGEVRWFRQLCAQVRELQRLQVLVRECLDVELGRHCYFLSTEKNVLLMGVENAIWATQLRYSAPELIKSLRKHPEFSHIKTVRCIIQPSAAPVESPPRKLAHPRPISAESAKYIREVAEGVRDPKLREALRKLGGITPPNAT